MTLGAGYSVIALGISIFAGRPLAGLFLEASETVIMGNVRFFLILSTAFYFPLALVNIIRFLIQGMGFPAFAILAGVFEMIARALAGFLLVPALGFTGAALGSPIAWVFADAFLIPAYFHVKKALAGKLAAAARDQAALDEDERAEAEKEESFGKMKLRIPSHGVRRGLGSAK